MLDSVLIANEVVDDARRWKKACLILKVDFAKAYDCVCWEFLLYMTRRIRFTEKWISWIKVCPESTSISVLVNGSHYEEFHPGRGLRQGDPIAPFLFLIVAKGLSGFTKEALRMTCILVIKLEDSRWRSHYSN